MYWAFFLRALQMKSKLMYLHSWGWQGREHTKEQSSDIGAENMASDDQKENMTFPLNFPLKAQKENSIFAMLELRRMLRKNFQTHKIFSSVLRGIFI